jgi:Fe-S-cluster containining protein
MIQEAARAVQFMWDFLGAAQDHALKETAKEGYPTTCAPGCHACCSMYVSIKPVEAEVLARYVRRSPNLLGRLQTYMALLKSREETPDYQRKIKAIQSSRKNKKSRADERAQLHLSLKLPCPFLSEEGYCDVYPIRPATCRAYYVVSDPKECHTHDMEGVMSVFVPEESLAEVFGAITRGPMGSDAQALADTFVAGDAGPLPEMVSKQLAKQEGDQ